MLIFRTRRHNNRPAFHRHCWAGCWRKWRVLTLRRCSSFLCSCCRGSLPGFLSSTSRRSSSCTQHSMASTPAASLMLGKRRQGTKKRTASHAALNNEMMVARLAPANCVSPMTLVQMTQTERNMSPS